MTTRQYNAVLKAISIDLEKKGKLSKRTKKKMSELLESQPTLEGTGILSDAISHVKAKATSYIDNALTHVLDRFKGC